VRNDSIYLISPLGGAERKIATAMTQRLAWTPDGKSIAFNDGPLGRRGGVILLDVKTGQRRQLTNPQAAEGGDFLFDFSPDGRRLAFYRSEGSGSPGGQLYVMPLPDGPAKRVDLPHTQVGDFTWAPGAKDLLASISIGGPFSIWRAPVESGKPAPVAGLDDSSPRQLAVSRASGRLAYSRQMSDENIWTQSRGLKNQLVVSTRRDFSPRLSPDEKRIAFTSDRTGAWEIYVSDLDGGRLVQLTSFGDALADGASWSPDGGEIVFAALRDGNRDIYLMRSEGGAVRKLISDPSEEGRPTYSVDGKWVYFRSNRSGKEEIWKMPRAGGTATQFTQGGGFEGFESFDGGTFYFIRGRQAQGLWSMPSAGGAAHAVNGLESVTSGRWAVFEKGICHAQVDPPYAFFQPAGDIICWNSSTQRLSRMGRIDKPIFNGSGAFSVSRDGARFFWAQLDHQDADLVLVENFR
jgi:Tol biopolymer transport system component